ncbi:MAG TPA: DegT/DnrJ/EryC1/StrS family aminotransferase, partial [Terriglobia bacterium]|nr:DegT/DnrJ/EryC1/StrS family aminotransferase [Terriglobia bacterium]
GDEVITTPLTFCATVNTILQVGATPVLADIGKDGNIDPLSIERRLTRRTRAIMPVHIGGLPCDMDSIWRLARENGLYVIEDAAHAIGACYKGRPIGEGHTEPGYRSDAVCFSFYATKNLTTGEGGMVVTPNEDLYNKMKVLCLHGISKDAWNRYAKHGNWYYEVVASGFKYNLTDIQSSIGIHQLRKIEKFTALREQYAERYNEAFAKLPELETPPVNDDCRHAWHLYALRLNLDMLEIDRGEFIRLLQKKNIGTSVHFIPIPLHPYFAQLPSMAPWRDRCPNALQLFSRLVSLPLYPSMTAEQVDYVIKTVGEVVTAVRKKHSKAIAPPAESPALAATTSKS